MASDEIGKMEDKNEGRNWVRFLKITGPYIAPLGVIGALTYYFFYFFKSWITDRETTYWYIKDVVWVILVSICIFCLYLGVNFAIKIENESVQKRTIIAVFVGPLILGMVFGIFLPRNLAPGLPTIPPIIHPTITQTKTPTPRITSTHVTTNTFIPSPSPTITPLFSEDFNGLNPDFWNLYYAQSWGSTSFITGKLKTEIDCVPKPNEDPAQSDMTCEPRVMLNYSSGSDFKMTFDLTYEDLSDSSNAFFSVNFREDNEEYYQFRTNSNGTAWLYLYFGEKLIPLVEPKRLGFHPEKGVPITFEITANDDDFSVNAIYKGVFHQIITAEDVTVSHGGHFTFRYIIHLGESATISVKDLDIYGMPALTP